jgi:hypothetical protein
MSATGVLGAAERVTDFTGRGLAAMPGAHRGALVATTSTFSNFKPTAGALPGGTQLLHLVDGLGAWALILALAGLVIGAALWAIGSHSQNYQQSYVGRRVVLVSGVAALLIGAAPTLIGFFFKTGQGIVNPL